MQSVLSAQIEIINSSAYREWITTATPNNALPLLRFPHSHVALCKSIKWWDGCYANFNTPPPSSCIIHLFIRWWSCEREVRVGGGGWNRWRFLIYHLNNPFVLFYPFTCNDDECFVFCIEMNISGLCKMKYQGACFNTTKFPTTAQSNRCCCGLREKMLKWMEQCGLGEISYIFGRFQNISLSDSSEINLAVVGVRCKGWM